MPSDRMAERYQYVYGPRQVMTEQDRLIAATEAAEWEMKHPEPERDGDE